MGEINARFAELERQLAEMIQNRSPAARVGAPDQGGGV
jgi:hypothetical protein